jgi:aminomethyltransferase
MAPFAGYEMPIQYKGVIEEHQAVREHAGLFDVSHMGLLRLEGARSVDLLNLALTRDMNKLKEGRAVYALMCQESGGTIDDLIVYRASALEFYLVLNASNKHIDFDHLNGLEIALQVRFEVLFDQACIFALQGPKAFDILNACGCKTEIVRPFDFIKAELCGIPVQIAFTGYTGEKGCEIFVSNESAVSLWTQLLEKGASHGIKPCGLASRDSLRLEMGYSLYGHELSESINPIEAGLSWAVDFGKEDFIGKDALERANVLAKKKIVALKSNSKQAPRAGMKVFDSEDREVGHITSGSFAPSLGHSIGLALVQASCEGPYKVEIRNQKIPFESTSRPFYKKN